MKNTEILIIGGGPAGLCAALSAKSAGAEVMLVDRNPRLGGQLFKQTHKFFGSKEHHASERGMDIAAKLVSLCEKANVNLHTNTTALGYFGAEKIVPIASNVSVTNINPQKTIFATGASEKFLAFENNDLPGIYGAGAVQTLMNEYGVRPGKKVIMVGAGNIGLIVSYQLLQAGVEVTAIIEGSKSIGGYWVHSSKLRRAGVKILTSHTILAAHGKDCVESATIAALDDSWNVIEGSQKIIEADVICIAVGLTPLTELLWQAGCQMKYVPELGGNVPLRNSSLETSVNGLYVAGDVCGVEEASAAMLEGTVAGISAAQSLGYKTNTMQSEMMDALNQLEILRDGPVGEKTRSGLTKTKL